MTHEWMIYGCGLHSLGFAVFHLLTALFLLGTILFVLPVIY